MPPTSFALAIFTSLDCFTLPLGMVTIVESFLEANPIMSESVILENSIFCLPPKVYGEEYRIFSS